MIKINSKNVLNFLSFKAKTTEQISKEKFQLNIGSSVLALSFLSFFMFIDKIPIEYVLTLFSLLTDDWFKAGLLMISIFFLLISYIEKNFSYVLFISIFLTGHFLFVNVYDDKYSIKAATKQIDLKKKKKMHFYVHQNLA